MFCYKNMFSCHNLRSSYLESSLSVFNLNNQTLSTSFQMANFPKTERKVCADFDFFILQCPDIDKMTEESFMVTTIAVKNKSLRVLCTAT